MSQEKIKVGVIGAGIGVEIHIPGFQACPDAVTEQENPGLAAAMKFKDS